MCIFHIRVKAIKMSSQWNHGKISRNDAEQLLLANGKNGAFLVRQSESVNDAHVLSLWYVELLIAVLFYCCLIWWKCMLSFAHLLIAQ